MIENQAASLGDLSIENKQQAVKLGDLAGQNERLMQAVQNGKTEMSDMRDQIVRLTDLILLISNRTDLPSAPPPQGSFTSQGGRETEMRDLHGGL